MKISRGLWTVAGVAAMLWVAAPAASHGPSGHGEAPQPGSKDAMKAQHERMANFKKATDMLSYAIIHNAMEMAREGAETLGRSLAGHEQDVPHKKRSQAKEFHGLYLELGKRTENLKKAIRADDLPKAAVTYGRILETCATCHRIFRD